MAGGDGSGGASQEAQRGWSETGRLETLTPGPSRTWGGPTLRLIARIVFRDISLITRDGQLLGSIRKQKVNTNFLEIK